MKNLLTLLVLSFFMTALTQSCKEHKHDHSKESEAQEHHAADKADIAMNAVFQCPMDCEEGKTYEEEGTCPVCKMDLKKVEDENHEETHDHDNGEDHEH